MATFTMTTVESDFVESVGRNENTGTVAVKLRYGPRYYYKGVPAKVFNSFLNAPSKGVFFARNIRNVYQTTKHSGHRD